MGFLDSLFKGGASRSPNAMKLIDMLNAYLRTLNTMFFADPLNNQLQDPQKRKVILCFLLGAADFVGRHVKKMPDDTVLDCFAIALEVGLGLSQLQARKACDDSVKWSGDYDGRLYIQQGAMAFCDLMEHKTPASKNLRIMLAFSDPAKLRQFLETGADFDNWTGYV